MNDTTITKKQEKSTTACQGESFFVCPDFLHRVCDFRISDIVPLSEVILLGVVDTEAIEPEADDCVLEVEVLRADGCADDVDDFEEEGYGAEGSGHVMSAARVDLQCILMFSYKYHCLVRSSPGMVVFSGMDICRSDIDTPGFSKSILTAVRKHGNM